MRPRRHVTRPSKYVMRPYGTMQSMEDDLEAQLKDSELQHVSEREAYELSLVDERVESSIVLEKEKVIGVDELEAQ